MCSWCCLVKENQPTRILQTKSFYFSFSVTLRVTPSPLNFGFSSSVWSTLDYSIGIGPWFLAGGPSLLAPWQIYKYICQGARREGPPARNQGPILLLYNICKCLLFLSVKASPGCIIGHLMEDAAIRGRIFAPFPSSIPPPATSHKSKKRLCDQISIWSPAATKLTWDHDDFFLLSKS